MASRSSLRRAVALAVVVVLVLVLAFRRHEKGRGE